MRARDQRRRHVDSDRIALSSHVVVVPAALAVALATAALSCVPRAPFRLVVARILRERPRGIIIHAASGRHALSQVARTTWWTTVDHRAVSSSV